MARGWYSRRGPILHLQACVLEAGPRLTRRCSPLMARFHYLAPPLLSASKSSTDSSTTKAPLLLLHRLHSMQPVSRSPRRSISISRSPQRSHCILATFLNHTVLLPERD